MSTLGDYMSTSGRVFPRLFTHGGICPPTMGGTSAGRKIVNGGTHEGGHRPYEGT